MRRKEKEEDSWAGGCPGLMSSSTRYESNATIALSRQEGITPQSQLEVAEVIYKANARMSPNGLNTSKFHCAASY